MLMVCDCIPKYWIVIFQNPDLWSRCPGGHWAKVITDTRDSGQVPDQWSGHTVTPPIREILVPRHWPPAPTSRGRVTIDINGSNIGGPIVEHNGDISFDLQHKDCVCGMKRKGHSAGQLMDTRYWAEYRVVDWVFVSSLGRAENRNWTVAWCGQLQSAAAAVSWPVQWAPPEKLQKMREMRINWWYGGDGHWRSSFLNKPTTGSSEINL